MSLKYYFSIFFLLSFSIPVSASPSEETGNCTQDQFMNSNQCLNGVGPGVIGSDSIRVTTNNVGNSGNKAANEKNDEVAFGHSHLNGLAAGDSFQGWGIWGNVNYTNFDSDLPINATVLRARFDGDTKSVMFGADRLFLDRLVLGLAGGYEDTEVFTSYNGGNNDSDGFTIAPYIAYLINEHFSVDASFGYTSLEYDTDRISVTDGTTTVGSFDSDRTFFTSNLNVSNSYGKLFLSGRLGYLYTHEDQDGYTESGSAASVTGGTVRTIGERNLHLSQIIVGAEIAYDVNPAEIYFGTTYANDITRGIGRKAGGLPGGVAPTQDDDDEFQLSYGVRYFGESFSANLDFLTILNRNNFDSQSVMFTLRTDL